ncbi:MAG: peroxidase, partial [Methylococcales bacterium]
GYYTARPLIDPGTDANAEVLADALDKPGLKDFTRNGTYLVLRHLSQDVPKFWQFLDQTAAGDAGKREQLATAMVGRSRDGTPLVSDGVDAGQGQISNNPKNNFTYKTDPHGQRCPIGAHIRRSNPRSADLPSGSTGFISRFLQMLGFKLNFPDDDLVASARFHRLLRRGRTYGPTLSPEDALKPETDNVDRGLHFICLGANISRQFEFVQNAWLMSSKFAAVHQEQDALLGQRSPLLDGETTSNFNRPDAAGPERQTCALPQFITVKGGGYFFMPGLRALSYLANLSKPRS